MLYTDSDATDVLNYLDSVIDRVVNDDINSIWILLSDVLDYSDNHIKEIIEKVFRKKLDSMLNGNIVIETEGWLSDE